MGAACSTPRTDEDDQVEETSPSELSGEGVDEVFPYRRRTALLQVTVSTNGKEVVRAAQETFRVKLTRPAKVHACS